MANIKEEMQKRILVTQTGLRFLSRYRDTICIRIKNID